AGRSHRKTPTRCGQADADCRHPIPRADRLAADKPEYETAGGGAGEGALAFGTPYAISLAVPLYRDRADARSRCRALLYPAPPDPSPHVAWHSSCATPRRLGLRTGGAAGDDALARLTGDRPGAQFKPELVAHHASEEAAHRVPLPMGDAHDGSNGCPLRST